MIVLAAGMDAAKYIKGHITDHWWPNCRVHIWGMDVTWMSTAIAMMILAALVVLLVVIPMARRPKDVPRGVRNVVELLVIFARDMIARPALGANAYKYLPFLMTMFVFILTMNLLGMLPLIPISHMVNRWLGVEGYVVGGAATGVAAVCAGLASLTLIVLLGSALWASAQRLSRKKHVPLPLALVISPIPWILSLSHPIPGLLGKFMLVPMALLEFIGVLAKIFALMVRLFANMLSGHGLLAVFLMFVFQLSADWLNVNKGKLFGVSSICVIASVLVNVLELLVAGLQAYIFTFLSAIFLGLYVDPAAHTEHAEHADHAGHSEHA